MLVYVLNKHGEPLMPCKPRKARILLKENKVKVVNQTPFTIQLLYGSSGYKQSVNLGVDAGSKHIGLSVTTKKQELFKATVELRQDISKLLETKRILRRGRRNKLRYQPPRFTNRGKKGKVSPSIQQKIDCHITIIKKVLRILPVENIIIESAEFDIQKLKNPNISGKEYQNGDAKGFYNVKQAVLSRDNYTCQLCGKQKEHLHVHHIVFKSKGGSNRMDNLVTLCSECHEKIHKGELKFNKKSQNIQTCNTHEHHKKKSSRST